ncbi:MAG TPA: heavy-metal-associated domain-containing protein [Planctomycetota bacterium]|nr:heavy-metal-associated domain-containing protein [Planctomycetota bacterium]
MKSIGRTLLVAASCLAVLVAAKRETKVELKGVHICCGACEKAIGGVLDGAGVKGTCDKGAGTVTFTASDDAGAQKALDALAAAGFHGTSSAKISIHDDSGAKAGKVATLTLTGAHNCCGACCKALKGIVGKVEGVKSEDIKPKEKTFTVTGDFDAAALVKALNDGGFHVKVQAK